MSENKRKPVVPGEVIFEGDDYLPGDGTEKRDNKIYSLRYGLAEESNHLVKVIPLSGRYEPRRGNVVIGKVELITFNGWVIDIGSPDNAFLTLMEVPRFVNKDNLEEVLDMGDMVIAKISSINKRGIDLTLKSRGLGKIEEGIVFKVNSNKVPRIIGKEGSMIKMIKDETGCNITVGQNGMILIKGDSVEKELFAKEAIKQIEKKTFISGLTDAMVEWFKQNKEKGE
ncbi:MAG: S1 RNA-binding domain-containing protein [Nanoarchaeota archaeon]|nr:S1 RNA-binding domain-containing protein [Nanoarchaeota archaeon]